MKEFERSEVNSLNHCFSIDVNKFTMKRSFFNSSFPNAVSPVNFP